LRLDYCAGVADDFRSEGADDDDARLHKVRERAEALGLEVGIGPPIVHESSKYVLSWPSGKTAGPMGLKELEAALEQQEGR
jgi:hypothetical protein